MEKSAGETGDGKDRRRLARRLTVKTKSRHPLAHEMLLLTAIETSEELGRRMDIELRDLLIDEVSALQARSAARGIAWEIDAEEPIRANCEGYAIARALHAILQSALERAIDGSVLRVSLRGDRERAILSAVVAASGVHSSDHADLRLAVARSVIDAHGGALSVHFHDEGMIRIVLVMPCGVTAEH
jgi:K+-sensing histidine kinase KdpD